MARMMAGSGSAASSGAPALGPAPSKASVQLGRMTTNMVSANPSLRQAIDNINAGGKTNNSSGVVGGLFNNPIAKTALNGLNLLAVPGRAVNATIREAVDAVDGKSDTRASFGDFTKNVKDPTFGFGKAFHIDTGNIWVDRGIGLVGDIFTDPLTYATFGAGKFAGYAGRLDLAKSALRLTGDQALANNIQRYGRAAIKDSDLLERLGANRHGVYFLGKRVKVGYKGQGVRLPGSGAIGMLGDAALSKMRVGMMGTRGGKFLQRITLPAEGLAARQALLQGEMGDEAAATSIAYFTASPVARRAAGEALQKENVNVLKILTNERAAGLEGVKDQLANIIEDADAFARATPELQQRAQVWIDLFKRYEDDISKRYAEIDPTATPGWVENYFPRMQTDEAIAYRTDRSNPHSKSLNEIFDRDPMAGGKNFKSRTMEVGDDFFGQKLTAEDLKSVDKLNKIANDAGFVGKFFETDVTKVVPRYIEEYAKEVGVLARHKHLHDTGFWERASAIEVSGEFIDKELIDGFKKTVRSLDDDMRQLQRQFAKSHIGLQNALAEHRDMLVKNVSEARASLGELEDIVINERALDDVLNGSLTLTADELQIVADNLGGMKQKFAAMFNATFEKGKLVMKEAGDSVDNTPLVADGLLGYLDNLENDILALRLEIGPLERDMVGKELAQHHQTMENRVGLLRTRLQDAHDRIKMVTEFGNILESTLDAMAKGTDVGDIPIEVAHAIGIIARDGQIGSDTVREIIQKQFNLSGELQTFINKAIKEDGSIFSQVTMHSGLKKTAVSKMKVSDFYESLPRLFGGEMSINRVRELALFSLISDNRLYADQIPETLQGLRAQVIEQLRLADEAVAFNAQTVRSETSKGKQTLGKIFESEVTPAYDRATNYVNAIEGIDVYIPKLEKTIAENPGLADMPVTYDAIQPLLRDHPWLGEIVPQQTGFDFYEDLMGVNMSVPMNPRGNSDFVTGERFSLGGETVADVQLAREASKDAMTYGELVTAAKSHKSKLEEMMNGPFFAFGKTGFNEKTYTGRELLEMFEEYKSLSGRLTRMRATRAKEVETIQKSLGFDLPDDEIIPLARVEKIRATAKSEKAANEQIAIEAKARRAAIKEEATTKANQKRVFVRQGDIETDIYGNVVYDAKGQPKRMPDITEMFGDQYTKTLDAVRSISGGGTTVRPANWVGLPAQRDALSNALINYTMASEVHSRFNALAELTSSFGFVPTQRMFAEVTRSVGNKFIPGIESKLSNITHAHMILEELDKKVARAIAGKEGVSISEVFKNALDTLPQAQRDVLTEVIGHKVNWAGDPYTLKRRMKSALAGKSKKSPGPVLDEAGNIVRNKSKKPIMQVSERTKAENAFYDEYVKPWFETAYPNKTASKENMKAALKENVPSAAKGNRGSMSPFADDADSIVVKRWFEGLIGRSEIAGTRSTIVGGEAELVTKMKALRTARMRFKTMLAPDVNIAEFFNDPGNLQRTGTWYASLLQDHADRLERRITAKLGVNEAIVERVGKARSALETAAGYETQASRLTGAVSGDVIQLEKDIAAIKAEIASIETNPKASQRLLEKKVVLAGTLKEKEGQLSQINTIPNLPKKAQAVLDKAPPDARTIEEARRVVDRYNEGMLLPIHVKAQADKEIVDAIHRLAQYDLHMFSEGFTKDGVTFATLANGEKITFSEAEWKSLFLENTTRNTAPDLINDVNIEIRQHRTDLMRLGRLKAEWLRRVEQASNAPMELNVERSQAMVDDIIAEIETTRRSMDELMLRRDALDPAVNNAALEKMRVLVHGIEARTGRWARPGSKPVFDADGIARVSDGTHPSFRYYVESKAGPFAEGLRSYQPRDSKPPIIARADDVASRRAGLMSVWNKSPEALHLKRMQQLENNVFVQLHGHLNESVELMTKHHEDILNQIRQLSDERTGAVADVLAQRDNVASIARDGADELEKNTGKRVLATMADGTEAELPIPRTPEQARTFADQLEKQSVPDGPFVVKGDGNNALEESYTDAVNIRGDYNAAKIARDRAKAESAEWAKGKAGRVKEAVNAWESRIRYKESVEVVVDAVRTKRDDLQTQIMTRFGDVDGFWNEIYNRRGIIDDFESQLNEIDALINDMPQDVGDKVLKKMRGGKATPEEISRTRDAYREWMRANKPVFTKLGQEPDNPVYKAWAAAAQADADLIYLDFAKRETMDRMILASAGEWQSAVIEPMAKEWKKAAKQAGLLDGKKSLKSEGLPGLYGNKEAIDLIQSLSRMNEPGVITDLSKMMRGYTGFFRSYATLSPGFHVRNSISNIFAMFSAGADIGNMQEGFRLWRLMDDAFKNGKTIEEWVNTLPQAQQANARIAAQTVVGLGNTQADDALAGFARQGNMITDNAGIRISRKTGQKVEGSARFMLAYDSLAKGFTEDEAFNRTRRYLIDYSEKSILDESMRDIIPFWTWMSRNMPLQVVNRWANPKPYLMYMKFKNNFTTPNEEGEVTPLSMLQIDALNLGGGNYLSPDLPFTRVDQQWQDLQNPRKLLAMVNPGIRVPLEMVMNTNAYTGQQFKDEWVPVGGMLKPLIPALEAAGQIERDSNGNAVIRKKALYALTSMNPLLGRAERMFPSGEGDPSKVQNAFAGFMGVPVSSVSPEMQDAERFRRLAELQRMQQRQKNIEEAK
jgi:hypothetical protein